jgi:hypothetical protein
MRPTNPKKFAPPINCHDHNSNVSIAHTINCNSNSSRHHQTAGLLAETASNQTFRAGEKRLLSWQNQTLVRSLEDIG